MKIFPHNDRLYIALARLLDGTALPFTYTDPSTADPRALVPPDTLLITRQANRARTVAVDVPARRQRQAALPLARPAGRGARGLVAADAAILVPVRATYMVLMVMDRAIEESGQSQLYATFFGLHLPTRYFWPFELAGAILVLWAGREWLKRRMQRGRIEFSGIKQTGTENGPLHS